jgi:glycosyltransferase involved in cell wall biosynthesis
MAHGTVLAPNTGTTRVRVAMAGIRGIPAHFGGSETAVEEIGRRLAAEGASVVVYCRRHASPDTHTRHLGMRRTRLPSINTFNLDTISHSFLASLHLLLRSPADLIHFHGMGNALVLPLFRLSRKKTVITIDGPDWERPKWGWAARAALKLSALMATKWADRLIIDNHPSLEYFARQYGTHATYIPYGAYTQPPESTSYLREIGLSRRGYVIFVGALVPDKGPDVLIDAYRRVGGELPLIIVGDSPFFSAYRRSLREMARGDDRIRFLGYVYGEAYRQLVANCHTYVHPLRSDGTSPALLQAMGYGSCIVTNSLPEALSAAGDAALPYARDDPSDLAHKLELVLRDPARAGGLRSNAAARARTEYDWDRVAEQHRQLYESVT